MTMSLSTGLISGMDTGTLIAQLVAAEGAPKTALQARLKTTQDNASAYQTINTTFLAVTAAAEAALQPEAWTPIKATSSAPGVAVSATAGALAGSLTFTVDQLAASHAVMNRNTTAGDWTSSTSLYGAAQIVVTDSKGVALAPITVGGTGTLADAAAAINASPHGLTASVVQVDSGEAALRISAKETGLRSTFTVTGAGAFTVNTAAADAEISMGSTNAVTVSSPTNTFDSVMPGATFTVSKVDEVATLTVAPDPSAVAAKLQTLIDAVNAAVKVTRDYTSNEVDSKAQLNGDYAVGSLAGRLLDAVAFGVVDPATGKEVSPAKLGIELSDDGKSVKFDKNVFLNELKANPALAQLIAGGTAAGPGGDTVTGTSDDVEPSGIAGRLLAVAQAASDKTTGTLVAMAKGQESLADDYQARIEAWDVRLAKRKEMLTRQFTAMETALSSLRNQSTWLAGQINSLSAG